MSGHPQSKAVRIQSSAVVLAAAITTCGAVSSALIQSGWIDKAPLPEVAAYQTFPPVATQSSAAVTPEPFDLQTIEVPRPSAPPRVRFTSIERDPIAFHAPAWANHSSSMPDNQAWNVAKPALAGDIGAPLYSPPTYAGYSTGGGSSLAATTQKKPFDWRSLTRIFPWQK